MVSFSENSGNQIEIEAGSYQFNFQAILPPLLPTSFEAKHGFIRYLINVVIDRPWKFDLTYKVAFTVIKQLDMNYENPALRIPTKLEVFKTFYCWMCKTAPLYVAASIPMSGYVAGQNVNVSIEINNESSIDVEDVKVTLKKFIFYNSQTPSKKTKEEVLTEAEIRGGGVLKRNKGKFDLTLLIPPVPPSNMNYCRILNVSYEIHVTAKIAGIHKNPVIRLPITIGTVPLNAQVSQNQHFAIQYPTAPMIQTPSPNGQYSFADTINNAPQNMQQNTGNLGKRFMMRSLNWLNVPLLFTAPPSYHEAMGSAVQLNEEGEHPMGVQPFHPMYPVYNFNQQATAPSSSFTLQSSPSYEFIAETSNSQPSIPTPGSISDSAIIQKY